MRKTPKSKEEALAINAKRKRKLEFGTEETLQGEIVKQYRALYPDSKNLWAVINENTGGNSRAKGILKGVSDLHLCRDGKLIGIEIKHPDESHGIDHIRSQAEWLANVPFEGYFCDSVEMFWHIVNGGDGYHPETVMNWFTENNKRTIKFKFLRKE